MVGRKANRDVKAVSSVNMAEIVSDVSNPKLELCHKGLYDSDTNLIALNKGIFFFNEKMLIFS